MLNKNLDSIAGEVSKEMGIPKEVVLVAYRSFFQFSRDIFANIPFDELQTEEDLNKYRVSINVPFLGKFYSNWNRVLHTRIKRENIKRKNESNQNSNKEN